MLVCPKCDKPTRIAHQIKEVEISGEKKQKSVRVCKKCGKVID
jgi:large subunit ribosomal protein L24